MSGPVKRRRRGGSVCANPLFVRWVEELRDDCKERGLKSYHTYTKVSDILTLDVFTSKTLYLFLGTQLPQEIPITSSVRGGGKNT